MADSAVGDTVQVTGTTMTGDVGTAVHIDEARGTYLVRVSDTSQTYVAPASWSTSRPDGFAPLAAGGATAL
jgi:hypothetical protein